MSITEQNLEVGESGRVTLQIPRPAGSQVRVIVLDLDDEPRSNSVAGANLERTTGFAQIILANPSEDAWNDL
jgi:hypothetical protein